MTIEERLAAYARLTLKVGVNLQPGQRLAINAFPEHAPLVRAVADVAYAEGARFVDVVYSDQHVRRSHITRAAEEHLGWSPPWLVKRLDDLGEEGGALLAVTGNPEPEIFAGLDGGRIARARMRAVVEAGLRLTNGPCNWSIVAYPNAGWAEQVFGEPDIERLWAAVATAVRLDEPDPVAAWQTHIEALSKRAAALNARRFDALRYRGPGTDLTIGLLARSRWHAADDISRGIKHVANMPTEEVFTVPDARRTEGIVRSTYPLQLQGTVIRNLTIRFEEGRAVEVHADEGEEFIRAHIASDEGASRLGEAALVDRSSRVGQTGVVFYDTLFDENAASHIALGAAITQCVEGAEGLSEEEQVALGVNKSSLHTDFMIGSPEVDIWGVTAAGDEVPILKDGDWVLS
ncbi:MAG TPA: aminopeptidase [Gaiellaceae bacterium]